MSGPSLEKTMTEPDSFRPGEPGLRAHFLWDSLQARAFGKGLGSFHLYLFHNALEFFWDELYDSPLILDPKHRNQIFDYELWLKKHCALFFFWFVF